MRDVSSDRAPAEQAQSPEFNPLYHKKERKKGYYFYLGRLP
jgi:hypothetical protein